MASDRDGYEETEYMGEDINPYPANVENKVSS